MLQTNIIAYQRLRNKKVHEKPIQWFSAWVVGETRVEHDPLQRVQQRSVEITVWDTYNFQEKKRYARFMLNSTRPAGGCWWEWKWRILTPADRALRGETAGDDVEDEMEKAYEVAVDGAKRIRPWRYAALLLLAVLLAYVVVAYLVIPLAWSRFARRHPALEDVPGITHTKDSHPGDPINVALIGTENELESTLRAANWYRADALGLHSDLKIALDTVVDHPYDAAPVSSLYLWGRREDLAFEQPVGNNPRHRHHVRFWKSAKVDDQGNPLWVGAATYDKRVGLSHTTGQITHHIAASVDAERDHLFHDLQRTGRLVDVQVIDNFHQVREGRNGGGDPWYTDGQLRLGIIASEK